MGAGNVVKLVVVRVSQLDKFTEKKMLTIILKVDEFYGM